ncbi:MAG: galactose mutarotase [Bacteroidales bacterium]|jgi:aldose 1-epimerase|nr:galactose mutarotase [Bacteroidales bacterium]
MVTIENIITGQPGDKEIYLFRITNESGAYVELLNFGATVCSIVVPDSNGVMENVVLNYPDIRDYFTDKYYLGSTIGRFANRIANARFELNGEVYHLDKNDGENCNHGGHTGFHQKVFDYKIGSDSIFFYTRSKDGESGFPGNMDFSVRYSFSGDHVLSMLYSAVSDKETLFNPTSHAYFNLSGNKGNIWDHRVKIFSENYLEMNEHFLPTGMVLPVTGSGYDFRKYTAISQNAPKKRDILKGYNTCFVGFDPEELHQQASLYDLASRRKLDVFSTMPGLILYTGDYLGGIHHPFDGLCLEPQFYPDAPNHENFPSCMIYPHQLSNRKIQYEFSVFDH